MALTWPSPIQNNRLFWHISGTKKQLKKCFLKFTFSTAAKRKHILISTHLWKQCIGFLAAISHDSSWLTSESVLLRDTEAKRLLRRLERIIQYEQNGLIQNISSTSHNCIGYVPFRMSGTLQQLTSGRSYYAFICPPLTMWKVCFSFMGPVVIIVNGHTVKTM